MNFIRLRNAGNDNTVISFCHVTAKRYINPTHHSPTGEIDSLSANKHPVFGGIQMCIFSLLSQINPTTLLDPVFFNCIERLSSSLYPDVPNGPSHFCELMDISSLIVCYLASYGVYSEVAHFESRLEQESPWNFLFSSVHAGKCQNSTSDFLNLHY
jgi:hypothetical protein